ncbi:hypothetical protein [Brachybacterium epidermidis]|uniref:hypothetical protein n=1 Tax=Brachybacterium epidermidis TaxID=2781983 RepID=UPI00398F0FD9
MVAPRDALDEAMARNYVALRHLAKAKGGYWAEKRDKQLPRHSFLKVNRDVIDHAVTEWHAATEAERQIALDKQRREEEQIAEFERQWQEERRVKDLADSEEFLPSGEVCGKLGVKPGTLRQWANRGHVRVEKRQIRTVAGWRLVNCYSVADAVTRKRAAGIGLADRRAVNAQDALRMLRVAVLECERTGVRPKVLQKYLLMLAKGEREENFSTLLDG